MLRPAPLRRGDRAALIAPSFHTEPEELKTAVRSVSYLGLEPAVFPSCASRYDYLAGSDEQRAKDLMDAFSDPSIRAVFCLRGGYGAARLLELIDYDVIRNHPKIFVGFSDITALHTVFNQKCGLITFHGPMPAADYEKMDEDVSLSSLRRALFSEEDVWRVSVKGLVFEERDKSYIPGKDQPGEPTEGCRTAEREEEEEKESAPRQSDGARRILMRGRLCGGNLTVLAAALGTPHAVETAGKILFLEDTGERTYRIDRAVSSLRLAGRLGACSGVLLGTFDGCAPGPGGRASQQIIQEITAPLRVPVISGLPAGHSLPNMTLPMGACTEIDENGLTFYLK